jgi:hypothetical protein
MWPLDQLLPKRDVRAASVFPSTSDIMLQRRERRNGPTSDIPSAGRRTQIKDPGLDACYSPRDPWEGQMAINIAKAEIIVGMAPAQTVAAGDI